MIVCIMRQYTSCMTQFFPLKNVLNGEARYLMSGINCRNHLVIHEVCLDKAKTFVMFVEFTYQVCM